MGLKAKIEKLDGANEGIFSKYCYEFPKHLNIRINFIQLKNSVKGTASFQKLVFYMDGLPLYLNCVFKPNPYPCIKSPTATI